MKNLFKYFKGYKLQSVLAPLFKMLEATFELFVPLVVASIIDIGIKNGDRAFIVKMCALMALLGLIGLVCSATAQYFSARAAVGFAKRLRHALFDKIQHLSYTQLDTLGTSTVITRMTSDINQVQTGVNLTLRLLLRSPFVVAGAVVMAFVVDAKGGLVFAITTALLSVVVFFIMFRSIPLYKAVQTRLDKLTLSIRENLTGTRVIRAFGLEKSEIKSFGNRNNDLTQTQRFVGRISALMNPLTYAIINIAIVCVIYVGALRVNTGALSSGQVVALYSYMSQILIELIKFAALIISMTKAVASAKRVSAVLDMPYDNTDGDKKLSGRGKVEFKDVSLKYNGASGNTLTDISFSADPGQTIGIIGGTGSGKSSLVNLIPAFYSASEGNVLIDGVDVRDVERKNLIDCVAVVPQTSVLFSGTIRENMQWGNEHATDEQIMRSLTIAQASDVIGSKENGLDSMIEQGGRNLSGGQRQRLAIARALLKNAEILILDDSTSALDFATDAALRLALKNMDNKPTVFIVSQRTSSIRNADRIIVLDEGTTVGIGTHESLLENCEVYREIYDSQYKKEGL